MNVGGASTLGGSTDIMGDETTSSVISLDSARGSLISTGAGVSTGIGSGLGSGFGFLIGFGGSGVGLGGSGAGSGSAISTGSGILGASIWILMISGSGGGGEICFFGNKRTADKCSKMEMRTAHGRN